MVAELFMGWSSCQNRKSGLSRRFTDDMGRGDERDRRRTEARRYPIDDTELLVELRDQAVLAGGIMRCPAGAPVGMALAPESQNPGLMMC